MEMFHDIVEDMDMGGTNATLDHEINNGMNKDIGQNIRSNLILRWNYNFFRSFEKLFIDHNSDINRRCTYYLGFCPVSRVQ